MGLVIFLTASCTVALTALVLDFAGISRRGTAWRWQGTGVLLMLSGVLVSMYASTRGWSYTRLHALHSITSPIMLTGSAILLIGLVLFGRERRRARRAP